ncbi:MAG TPA: hypothetical protein VEP90_13935, partial [Methylomirabilota bacterium]|nr:hypothetical protein [Methylomirabilota bacterium]
MSASFPTLLSYASYVQQEGFFSFIYWGIKFPTAIWLRLLLTRIRRKPQILSCSSFWYCETFWYRVR